MASFARRQMEKYGWKDGQGIGKQNNGISTFVKAVRPKGERGECFGIGHAANSGTSNSDMGFDSVLQELRGGKKKAGKKAQDSDDSSDAEDAPEDDAASASGSSSPKAQDSDADVPRRKKHRADDAVVDNKPASPVAKKAVASDSDSSSSSSDDDAEDDGVIDWSDKKLFDRCGGVRLGRGGRHRFFDGKLARIEANNAAKEGGNPYGITDAAAKKTKRSDFA
jgi:hypothetical protein